MEAGTFVGTLHTFRPIVIEPPDTSWDLFIGQMACHREISTWTLSALGAILSSMVVRRSNNQSVRIRCVRMA